MGIGTPGRGRDLPPLWGLFHAASRFFVSSSVHPGKAKKESNFLSPLLRYSAPGGLRQGPDRVVESDLQELEERHEYVVDEAGT